MRLEKLTVGNYKSYLETQSIEIGKGFNLFIGGNNSGKTTALEALDFQLGTQVLHRSLWNLPAYGDAPSGNSRLGVTISTSVSELRALFGNQVAIPLPDNYNHGMTSGDHAREAFNRIQNDPQLAITLNFGGGLESFSVRSALGESKTKFTNSNDNVLTLSLKFNGGEEQPSECNVFNFGGIPAQLRFGDAFRRFFYRFSAQRFPAAHAGFTGIPPVLSPDASNLAFCLSQLQLNDSHGHETLCRLVHRVFPTVRWVQAPAVAQNQWEIRCLPCIPQERRDDLAVPLSQMGAGIGNVIAILYILLTSRHPQVIAIDEPNSFLHPKALRELLQILAAEGAQHQYILTAHSADVLTAASPTFVTVFSAEDGRTQVKQVRGAQVQDLRGDLAALGIRMTDLHGRDSVLWVEGQTEELVVPELLRTFCPGIAAGIAVLRVEHTSKFDRTGKEVKEVVDAYERLTSLSLVPPAVAILIDTEKRKEGECRKLERDTNGRLRFLPKAMLENYVLHAGAIVAVLNAAGESLSVEEVQAALDAELALEHSDDGAKILKNIFGSVSEARVEFRKTTHTPQLFTWLVQRAPEHLDLLRTFLREILQYKDS